MELEANADTKTTRPNRHMEMLIKHNYRLFRGMTSSFREVVGKEVLNSKIGRVVTVHLAFENKN